MSIVSGTSSYGHGRPRIVVHDQTHRPAPASLPRLRPPRRASVHRAPQEVIDDFWAEFQSKRPGKPTSIIPQRAYADKAARRAVAQSASGGQSTAASYAEAAAQCRAKVAHIVKECRRVNQKYRDPHFDLELDLQLDRRDCLESLSNISPIIYDRPASISRGRRRIPSPQPPPPPLYIMPNFSPQAVKRVDDIFDKPEFFIDGPTANDVRQGRDGDCWLMAALCTLSNKPGLIERVCVAHDAAVGVYGFVFHRDGEWFSEIIDDKLYLTKPDYDESRSERNMLEDRVRVNSEEAYRKIYQSNSGALYFAQCENPNETWLPLLEKAYAKAHGDYAAIEGGFTGEGIEDLTGGVTSELYTTDILDKEYFWKEELMKVNDTFLFGCSTGVWGKGRGDRGGIVEQHAYSVMRAIEMDGVRLVLLKNPWGRHEWRGAWSDGSKEWTADWIQKLNHRFGDDGSFWISYEDLLRKYQAFDRTRLFGDDWSTTSIWTTMNVPWTLEYNNTKFAFTLARAGPVVLVLSQLDERYFRGLEGQYSFDLSFRLHRVEGDSAAGDSHDDDAFDYVVRSQASYRMSRSVSVELELDAGSYLLLVKIDAQRDDNLLSTEDVIRNNVRMRREKLIRIGLAYDLAHSKGRIIETAAEKKERRASAANRKAKEKKRLKKHIMEKRALDHLAAKIHLKHERRRIAKARAKRKAQDEKRMARMAGEERVAEERTRKHAARRDKDTSEQPNRDQLSDDQASGSDAPGKVSGSVRNRETNASVPETEVGPHAPVPAEVLHGEQIDFTFGGDGTSAPAIEKTFGQPLNSQHDREHLTANRTRPSFDGRYDNSEQGGFDTRAPPFSLRGNRDDSREPSTKGSEHGRVGDRSQDLPIRQRMSRPPSPIYAPIPRGGSDSRVPSPYRFNQRHTSGHPIPPPSRAFPGPEDGERGPRGRRVQPPPYFHGQHGRSGDEESEPSSLSSLSDISDSELELIYRREGCGGRGPVGNPRREAPGNSGRRFVRPLSPGPPPLGRRSSIESLRGDYGVGDPWNAVAVVGLRVYYREVDGDKERTGPVVRLRVERRNPFAASHSDEPDETTDTDAVSTTNSDDDLGTENRARSMSDDEGGSRDAGGSVQDAIIGEERVLDVDDSLKDATAPPTQRRLQDTLGERHV
ncbi:hypothetical protein SEUCBS139899_003577 [Sporothrix eucalyptigena]|uniref:Calpain catalytic domain-containing protein n=1 Tax=Sporothrix eucalyptigena TaxID=1812306 RepID=A0ABP0B615_9PEZI